MLKKLGIRHSLITPYHPQVRLFHFILQKCFEQSNCLDERYNQTLQSMLSKAVMGHKEMWDEFIDSSVFAYNTSTHVSTTYSPFKVMFGRKARLPVEAELRPIPSNYDSRYNIFIAWCSIFISFFFQTCSCIKYIQPDGTGSQRKTTNFKGCEAQHPRCTGIQ